MTNETIEIRTSKEKFFHEYLILKKPVIDSILTKINSGKKTTLSDIPRRVLSQLLYYNDVHKDIPDEQRWSLLFSKNTKEQICQALDMKEHHLNIYFSQLRNIKVLNGKKINKPFIVYSSDTHSINFTFKLNGHLL